MYSFNDSPSQLSSAVSSSIEAQTATCAVAGIGDAWAQPRSHYYTAKRSQIDALLHGLVRDLVAAEAGDPAAFLLARLQRMRPTPASSAAPSWDILQRFRPKLQPPESVLQQSSASTDKWTGEGWLASLGVTRHLSKALLGEPLPEDELDAARELGATITSEALADGFRTSVEAMAAQVLPELRKLANARASTGVELHGKFVQEGNSFTLQYGDLSTFFSGLEGKIGAPDPKVEQAMEREHTASEDSHDEFHTGNYRVTTTPKVEWLFVATPDATDRWPVEEALSDKPDKQRSPLPVAELRARLGEFNAKLAALSEPELMLSEGFGARLYTGPMAASRRDRTHAPVSLP